MRNTLRFIIYFYILLVFGSNTHAANQLGPHIYFENYPSSWTRIAPKGQTVLIGTSKQENITVRVAIKKQDHENCKCNHFIIDIAVNGEEIVVPDSVYCDMNDLSRGKVFIEGKSMVLMLEGGDASTSYYEKIEFDRKHVKRWIVYVDDDTLSQDSIVQESTHYIRVY